MTDVKKLERDVMHVRSSLIFLPCKEWRIFSQPRKEDTRDKLRFSKFSEHLNFIKWIHGTHSKSVTVYTTTR
jgi:hypothetical protein